MPGRFAIRPVIRFSPAGPAHLKTGFHPPAALGTLLETFVHHSMAVVIIGFPLGRIVVRRIAFIELASWVVGCVGRSVAPAGADFPFAPRLLSLDQRRISFPPAVPGVTVGYPDIVRRDGCDR